MLESIALIVLLPAMEVVILVAIFRATGII